MPFDYSRFHPTLEVEKNEVLEYRAPKDTWIKTDQGRFSPPIAAIELPKPNTKKIGTEIIKATKDNIDANANI